MLLAVQRRVKTGDAHVPLIHFRSSPRMRVCVRANPARPDS
jgi:hypothetical protein